MKPIELDVLYERVGTADRRELVRATVMRAGDGVLVDELIGLGAAAARRAVLALAAEIADTYRRPVVWTEVGFRVPNVTIRRAFPDEARASRRGSLPAGTAGDRWLGVLLRATPGMDHAHDGCDVCEHLEAVGEGAAHG